MFIFCTDRSRPVFFGLLHAHSPKLWLCMVQQQLQEQQHVVLWSGFVGTLFYVHSRCAQWEITKFYNIFHVFSVVTIAVDVV